MGKAEERCRMDCVVVCEESLIRFEGMPVVVGDEPMATVFFDLKRTKMQQNVQNAKKHKKSNISLDFFRGGMRQFIFE